MEIITGHTLSSLCEKLDLQRLSYEYWCKKLQEYLGLQTMPFIKEYKDEIEYFGVVYKKDLWKQ